MPDGATHVAAVWGQPGERVCLGVPGPAQDDNEASDDEASSDDGMYEVGAILACRAVVGASPPAREFLVNWKGYTDGANSWEPEANIMDETLIRVFEERQAAELDVRRARRAGPAQAARARRVGARLRNARGAAGARGRGVRRARTAAERGSP